MIISPKIKKSISYFFTICMCTGLLTGLCGCGSDVDGQTQDMLTPSVTVTAEDMVSSVSLPVGGLEGVVDDNYRNFYEIFVYSFYDTNGDGIGDLKGVTENLDYVADLGCNGIWLMPIMPSGTYHKYDVMDYMKVDPDYGTLDDFKELVDTAHEKGIRVIIDFVINHSSSKHKWFKQACDYLATLNEGEEPDESVCPYVGYYHFSRDKVNSTWYKAGKSDFYYEGQFWSEMPDLNLANENLKKEIEAAADMWMDLGVDGFRMDAPLHFEENDTEFNSSVLSWLYEYCKAKNPDFYMVSEVWSSKGTIASYYASKTPSFFNFATSDMDGIILSTVRGTLSAEKFANAVVSYREDFGSQNPDYIDAPFITNHDQGRPCNMLQSDADGLKFAGGILNTLSGNPFVYYGEELGMKSKGKKDENKRLPMMWTSDSKAEGMTKGPLDADKGIEQSFPGADEQLMDPDSILNYYKRALRMRNENPEIARGIEEICPETSGNLALIKKTWEGSSVYIAINSNKEGADFDISAEGSLEVVYVLTLHDSDIPFDNGVLSMPERSICVLKEKK